MRPDSDAIPFDAEVIVATCRNPEALDLCLCALRSQDRSDFTICVAEDGDDEQTRGVVDRWRKIFGVPRLRHVTNEHVGFRKNTTLNRAIAGSAAAYLVFLDGDCLPRADFVGRHLALARPGRFLTGGVIRLNAAVSGMVDSRLVESGAVFSYPWLAAQGVLRGISDRLKAGVLPTRFAGFLEVVSPVRRTWNGGNASGWTSDIVAVNGFDETLAYGGEDVELGVRLGLAGIRGRHLRYSAPVLHLDHSRDYVDPSVVASNRRHLEQVRRTGRPWTEHGLRKGRP